MQIGLFCHTNRPLLTLTRRTWRTRRCFPSAWTVLIGLFCHTNRSLLTLTHTRRLNWTWIPLKTRHCFPSAWTTWVRKRASRSRTVWQISGIYVFVCVCVCVCVYGMRKCQKIYAKAFYVYKVCGSVKRDLFVEQKRPINMRCVAEPSMQRRS